MFEYNIINGEVTITKCYDKSVEYVEIPEFINGYPVTKIGSYSFHRCFELKNVIIPNSITDISTGTFWGCFKLNEIIIPNLVTNIGGECFYHCSSLKEIIIPNSVTNIGVSAFSKCTSIKNFTIPSSVNNIGRNAFYECDSMREITIPKQFSGYINELSIDNNNIKINYTDDCNGVLFNDTLIKLISSEDITLFDMIVDI